MAIEQMAGGVGDSGELAALVHAEDRITVRGRELKLADLVDQRLFAPGYLEGIRDQMASARPFAHLVVDGWFHPTLLALVREEFDLVPPSVWMKMWSPQESTRRSRVGSLFGPASELYFGIVNSGWFLDVLCAVSGVEDLLADPRRYSGGLHETRTGGKFGIHRDFDRHVKYGLRNEMVLITYLNDNWDPAWGGALELWDGTAKARVTSVEPTLGRSILMRHGQNSFHGHPTPLAAPPDRVRRSVATYYYSNKATSGSRQTTKFLSPGVLGNAVRVARRLAPPILWDAMTSVARRSRG
jgi:hypothetical protein